MKYIKSFNESSNFDSLKDEIKELGDNYLAYLWDDGFYYDLRYTGAYVNSELTLTIFKRTTKYQPDINCQWDDVKDHIIPF